MPYELFWYGEIPAFDRYMEKADLEFLAKDRQNYLNGQYTMLAVGQNVSGFGGKHSKVYPEEPMYVKDYKERHKTQEQKNIELYQKLQRMAGSFKKSRKAGP